MNLNVCRVCGGVDKLKSILDEDNEILDKLLMCANLNIKNPADLLPKLICEQCDKNLDLSYRLRKQSEATQKRLTSELKRTQNEQSLCGSINNNKLEFCAKKYVNNDLKRFCHTEGNGMEFINISDVGVQNFINLEQHITTTAILVEDDKDNGEIFYNSYSDCLIDSSKESGNDKLPAAINSPVFSNFSSIDLLSSSSLSSTNDSCVDIDNDHVMTKCSNIKSLTCGTCNVVCSTKKKYGAHIKQHGRERYQCIQCCKCFSTRFRLKRHEEIHKEIEFYQCSSCNRSYRALYNLNRHIRSVHSGKKSWECHVCNVSFSRVDVLKRHIQLHSDEKNYKCLLCDYSFKTKDYLYAHNRTYHSANAVKSKSINLTRINNNCKTQCGYCGKILKSLFAYKNHLLIHTNEKPYECESCQKKFRTIAALTIHQRVHDDLRPFQCDLCLKSFKQISHLKEHKILHSNNEPQHACSICQASFAKKSNLKAHMCKHTKEKPFRCADCSAAFSYMHLLQKHACEVHNRSAHKVYTDNDYTDEIPEHDYINGSAVSQSELYHYIDTVTDNDNNANFYHNGVVVDLIDDHQEMEDKISDGYSESIRDYIGMHSLNLTHTQIHEENLAESFITNESHNTEQKVDIFVTEDTKLASCLYNISKLE